METTNVAATATAAPTRSNERQLSVSNAVELFNKRVRAAADKQVLRWKEDGTWRTASWADWDKASREIGAGLVSLGLAVGDRASILANTRPEWVYTDIGILMAGAVS